MATTLTGRVEVRANLTAENTLDLYSPTTSIAALLTYSVATGTGANQAQVEWHDERTVAAGTNDDLDLAGVLNNGFGVVTFAKVKLLMIEMTTTTTTSVLNVGAAAANAWSAWCGGATHTVQVGADGLLLLLNMVDGWTVGAGATDVLRINNPGAAPITYRIHIIGTGTVA